MIVHQTLKPVLLAMITSCVWAMSVCCAVSAPKQVTVEVRDGVKLKTTVWLPADRGKYPAVFTRGYSACGLGGAAPKWNAKGYAFVSQQTRGNGGDDGSRFFPDDKDGYDCIQWTAEQP